jgi:hypothetical protein
VNGLPARYDVKVTGAYSFIRYDYKDFTDLTTGQLYKTNANVLQVYVSANY